MVRSRFLLIVEPHLEIALEGVEEHSSRLVGIARKLQFSVLPGEFADFPVGSVKRQQTCRAGRMDARQGFWFQDRFDRFVHLTSFKIKFTASTNARADSSALPVKC